MVFVVPKHPADFIRQLAEHPNVLVENFSGYGPQINPDEPVWG